MLMGVLVCLVRCDVGVCWVVLCCGGFWVFIAVVLGGCSFPLLCFVCCSVCCVVLVWFLGCGLIVIWFLGCGRYYCWFGFACLLVC